MADGGKLSGNVGVSQRIFPIGAIIAAMTSDLPSPDASATAEPTLTYLLKRVENLAEQHENIYEIFHEVYGQLYEIMQFLQAREKLTHP